MSALMDHLRHSNSPELQEFQFDDDQDGEEIESGSGFGGERVEGAEDYDAINDETFGRYEPTDTGDLETLAERTKLLDFDDEEHSSVVWPDPSSIPIPMDLSSSLFNKNIWGYHGDEPSTSKRDSSEDFFSFITNATLPQTFDSEQREQRVQTPKKADPPSKPKAQFLTEEDILRQTREEERPNLLNQLFESARANNLTNKQPTSSTNLNNNLNVLDLLNKAQKVSQPEVGSPTLQQPPPPPENSFLPGFHGPPAMNRMPFPMPMMSHGMPPQGMPPHSPMPPFNGPMNPMLHAVMMGKAPPPFPLPPGMTPQQWAQMAAHMMPPPGMPPVPPPYFNMPHPQHQQHYHGNRPYREYRERRPNLPSTKTISDFAFDPYAGLMSKKEREWLIKIQLIQCMGTGDPWDDDYYYAVWKDQNVLAEAPEEWKVQIKPKYYTFHDTYPADKYVPPVFNGSLGRPTHVTTSFPRQIIDLHTENGDEDESQVGKVNNQKKLRTVLLRIENASLALLECRDMAYKQAKKGESDVEKSVICEKVAAIVNSIVTPDKLPTIMLIQKGRLLIAQLLSQADDQSRCLILNNLVSSLSVYTRKIAEDSNVQPLHRAIVNGLRTMDLSLFKQFRDTFPIQAFEPFLSISIFAQHLCLSFLIGLIGRDELTKEETISGPIGEWLSSDSQERLRILYPVINIEAVEFDLLKLFEGLAKFPQNSIGFMLSEVLKLRIKHRPS
ncbi:unnamed protein product [Bursaphelenchus xylophilus]|uniref:(pine wood nematode) hypothetical protein n=1 Tax=Bursaphelenchus xylophilus TaxID=6326 RepID=A0A1I7SWH7_BURXY|nr:unnamed protein product [Bursaphelenchus xylophilus]CAG9099433.1 unnamed protein product [Bursaphelenchus xylophilus]